MEPTKQKSKEAYTVISLFAGCGGSSLGYKLAGFKELLAVEYNQNEANILELNFPDTVIMREDIRQVTGKDIMEKSGIKKGELDILDASPPCQGISISGPRKIKDKRNNLYEDFVRILKEIKPKAFVMENVDSICRGIYKGYFNQLLKKLINTGYNVKCKIMNSKYYAVPQSRQRLIAIGIARDIKSDPVFPRPSFNIKTVRDVLTKTKDSVMEPETSIASKKHKQLVSRIPMGKLGDEIMGRGHFFNIRRLAVNLPCFTIMASSRSLIHPFSNRYLTIAELKAFQSFPDNFKMVGSYNQQWSGIGNSVPPLLMKAIAETIRDKVLNLVYERQMQ